MYHYGNFVVWGLLGALTSLSLLYAIFLCNIFGLCINCFEFCHELKSFLFWGLIQLCWRAHYCLRPQFITCHYISILAPFLHDLLAYCASIFGLFSELKTVLFWPILHVSLRVFHGLRHLLYTLCYSSLFGLILHSILDIFSYCFGSSHQL